MENQSDKATKGERLGNLLDQVEDIHKQMNNVFLKNGLTTPYLFDLSKEDLSEWLRLKSISDRLTDEIVKLILSK